MKKIDVNKSVIYGNGIADLKKSFEYLNEEGYFSNYEDFSIYIEGILKSVTVSDGEDYPYTNKYDSHGFDYFIPKDKVIFEGEPKRYRPYKGLAELPFTIGNIIRYREKQSCNEYKGMVIEIEYQKDYPYEVNNIILGGVSATPQELFDNYELLDKDCQYAPFGFEPFGIEE